MVVRPVYHFTENFGLAVEAGTVRVSGYNLNYDDNPGKYNQLPEQNNDFTAIVDG